jgi:hypothetical protein
MLPTIVFVTAAGFVCGLLLLHWLALAFICAGASIVYFLVSARDALLIPKWFGLLAALQLAYLAGVVAKVLADEAKARAGGHAAGAGREAGRRRGLSRWSGGRRSARREPQARA